MTDTNAVGVRRRGRMTTRRIAANASDCACRSTAQRVARQSAHAMASDDAMSFATLVDRVRSEFLEMPGCG